jgi:hypothetical protein
MTTQDAHQDASLQEGQQPSESPQSENPQTNNEQPADKGPSAFSRFVRKHPIATAIIAGILLAGIVWLWKDIEGSVEQKRLIKAANEQLQTNQDAALKLLAKPMVWSIRAEWMRGNKEQVELMLVDVIKGSDLLYLHFLDMSGKVIVSTDKRLEGLPLEDAAVNAVLGTDTTLVLPRDKKAESTVLVAPVMGYDSRLGTLVMGAALQRWVSE